MRLVDVPLVVWLILAVIAVALILIKRSNKFRVDAPRQMPVVTAAPIKAPEKVEVVEEPAEEAIDDLELVAAITAAIAASLNTQTDKLIVRSIKRTTAWNEVSKREQISN